MNVVLAERSLISSFTVGYNEITRLLVARIEATGLNALEATVIRTVLLNPTTPVGAIRSTLALPASTATEAVDRLCARGYARREGSPFDRRLAIVRLTGPGKQAAKIVDAAIAQIDAEILAEADTSATTVTKVADAIELLAWRERRMRLRHW
jgi:DNA-binding MarR family transcriptional regulator